jgi:HEAT repeat protein
MNKYSEEIKELQTYEFDEPTLDLLIRLVSLNDYHSHIAARELLLKKGTTILPVMHRLVDSNSVLTRKEAAKIIKHIANRESIPVAIRLLEDVDGDIRWIGAECLIRIGRICIRPLLRAIFDHSDSYYLREGAHHVLSRLIRRYDARELKDLQHVLLNGELLETLPLKISSLLDKERY